MSNRNQGIDLLKILSMFGIVFMHVIVKGGVLDLYKTSLSTNSIYWFFECLFCCSVDCFGLISGYLSSQNGNGLTKVIKMWFQVVFYSLIIDLILFAFGYLDDYSLIDIAKDLAPIVSQLYWYFNAYVPICLLKDYIILGLDSLSKEKTKELSISLIIIFCVIGLLFDPFGVGYGYTPLWVGILFVFGYLANKNNIFEKCKSSLLVAIFIICTIANWLCNTLVTGVVLNYNSPTVLLSALCLLIVFSRLNINNVVIPKLSVLTFGVYLFHENKNISKLLISDKLLAISNVNNPVVVVLHALLYSLLVFAIGLLIEYIRKLLYKIAKIDKLIDFICEVIKNILIKLNNVIV